MTQDVWNFLLIGLSFALYIVIALKSRAATTKEYYVASSGVSSFANGMATAADWMSAATFISMAGSIAASGYDASRFLMGWTGGFVLLTTLIVPYLRKFNKFTVTDFLGDRFYSNFARFVGVVCAIFICMTYIMGQMRGVGLVFSRLFNIDVSLGVMIGAAIVFFYAGLGGMKGITYTQVAQYCVMVFAYTIPAVFISMLLTGNVIPQLGLIGDFAKDGADPVPLLTKLNELNVELGFSRYTDGSLRLIDMFCITAALMCGTAGLPHVIVRFFTVSDVKAVRQSACWTLLCIAVIYLTAPAIGAFARTNLMSEVHNTAYSEAPAWFRNWEDRGLIAWLDKNGDGVMQHSAGVAFAGKPVYDGERPDNGPACCYEYAERQRERGLLRQGHFSDGEPRDGGFAALGDRVGDGRVRGRCVVHGGRTVARAVDFDFARLNEKDRQPFDEGRDGSDVGTHCLVCLPLHCCVLRDQSAVGVCREDRCLCVWPCGVVVLSDDSDGHLFDANE